MTTLFNFNPFISHSGVVLEWKIDCDAFTSADWKCLAHVIATRFEFSKVIGIPNGGLKLEEALKPYIKPNPGMTLIVDDVMTTGKSMKEYFKQHPNSYGIVVFNRCPIVQPRIHSIFRLGHKFT